jgi:hypothetical protein
MPKASSSTVIIDPRGRIQHEPVVRPERPASLEGKTVGIVLDGPWRSWWVMAEQIAEILEEHDIRTKQMAFGTKELFDTSEFPVERLDEDDSDSLDAFARQVDTAIVGMGN